MATDVAASEPSKGRPSAWLDEAINRLWERFENRYGSLWMDRWAGLPMARVKAEWAEELRGFSADALRYGFDAVRGNRFPPTLPEFVDACRNAPREIQAALPAPNVAPEVIEKRLGVLAQFGKVFGKRSGKFSPGAGGEAGPA